jgi:V/A-type H+-transporting ATPase subunit D
MEAGTIPTKGNLLKAKKTLELSRQGYALLDKKRSVLINESFTLTGRVADIKIRIAAKLAQANTALQNAYIEMGSDGVINAANAIPADDTVSIRCRHIMGVEIPYITHGAQSHPLPNLAGTKASCDEACLRFNELKALLIALAETETAARRLTEHIKKTNKRANALKDITIPLYESQVKFIQDSLEESERDAFIRLKLIKKVI